MSLLAPALVALWTLLSLFSPVAISTAVVLFSVGALINVSTSRPFVSPSFQSSTTRSYCRPETGVFVVAPSGDPCLWRKPGLHMEHRQFAHDLLVIDDQHFELFQRFQGGFSVSGVPWTGAARQRGDMRPDLAKGQQPFRASKFVRGAGHAKDHATGLILPEGARTGCPQARALP